MNDREEKSKDGLNEKFSRILPIIKLSKGYYEYDLYEPIGDTFNEFYEPEVLKSELEAILEAEKWETCYKELETRLSEGNENIIFPVENSCYKLPGIKSPSGYYEYDIYEPVEECDRDSHEPIDCMKLGDDELIDHFHEIEEQEKTWNRYEDLDYETEDFEYDPEFFESTTSLAGDYDIMQYYCREEVEPMEKNLKVFYYVDRFVTQAEYEAEFDRYPSEDDMQAEYYAYLDTILDSYPSEDLNNEMADNQVEDEALEKEEFSCKALKINPQDAEMWYDKGTALAKLKRYDEANKAFDEALRINSQDVEMWYNKGYALERYGRNDEANKAFDEALKINSQDAETWYNKGNALENLGRNDEANKAFEKALKLQKISRSLK